MNIFFLSPEVKQCARYHCDKHVVKMILEYTQLLSTAHHTSDCEYSNSIKSLIVRPTHHNHPCAVWVRASTGNYYWLYKLLVELHEEYTTRYGKVHALHTMLEALSIAPANSKIYFTTPALAMPTTISKIVSTIIAPHVSVDTFMHVILCYRLYYLVYKKAILQYKAPSSIPPFINSKSILQGLHHHGI